MNNNKPKKNTCMNYCKDINIECFCGDFKSTPQEPEQKVCCFFCEKGLCGKDCKCSGHSPKEAPKEQLKEECIVHCWESEKFKEHIDCKWCCGCEELNTPKEVPKECCPSCYLGSPCINDKCPCHTKQEEVKECSHQRVGYKELYCVSCDKKVGENNPVNILYNMSLDNIKLSSNKMFTPDKSWKERFKEKFDWLWNDTVQFRVLGELNFLNVRMTRDEIISFFTTELASQKQSYKEELLEKIDKLYLETKDKEENVNPYCVGYNQALKDIKDIINKL